MIKKLPLLTLSMVFVFSSCRESNFLYEKEEQQTNGVARDYNVKEIISGGKVDILWVVDNSGSMGTWHKKVIQNAEYFMDTFTKNYGAVDWRLGLISTDNRQDSYLGLYPKTVFDRSRADPVPIFKSAVQKLGTSGDATEKTFDPIYRQLEIDQNFLRKDAFLAIVMLTDAEEQSNNENEKTIITYLDRRKGSSSMYRFFGIFAALDLGCNGSQVDSNWYYKGSPYSKVISQTGGFYESLCVGDFGQKLANIGKSIYNTISKPKIYLDYVPVIESLRVIYRGTDLPFGDRTLGGLWYFDSSINAIVFHDLSFAPNDVENVHVVYEKKLTTIP